MRNTVRTAIVAAAVALSPLAFATASRAQESVTLPNLSYRTGPFAATGIPLMNGQRDYINMLNKRDGGLNGVMLNYEECETGYSTEKGVECYEKTKAEGIVTQPWSTGITLQVLPKTNVDEIPILAPGYGFSAMQDGKTFQWAYNPPASYWDGASMILSGISGGDLSSLSGKKIAFLHLDHPYGKEPIPLFEKMAAEHGFEFLPIPVGLSEMQNQSAQWLQIRREQPDFVLMWGWGAMNAGAITEAVKTKYPMDQFIGIWWSGHDGDLKLVGEEGKGYRSISWSYPNSDAGVMQDIKTHIVDAGESMINQDEGEYDWVFYQRGVLISAMLVEGIRAAQEQFDNPAVTAEQLRWGLENLDFTEAKISELGLDGMIAPFRTTCANHTGNAGAWMLQWDGSKFVKSSDLLTADREAIDPLVQSEAAKYAEANAPWPTNDECSM